MRHAKLGGAFRLVLGELAEIIVKAIGRTAIEPAQNAGSQTPAQPAVAMLM